MVCVGVCGVCRCVDSVGHYLWVVNKDRASYHRAGA